MCVTMTTVYNFLYTKLEFIRKCVHNKQNRRQIKKLKKCQKTLKYHLTLILTEVIWVECR